MPSQRKRYCVAASGSEGGGGREYRWREGTSVKQITVLIFRVGSITGTSRTACATNHVGETGRLPPFPRGDPATFGRQLSARRLCSRGWEVHTFASTPGPTVANGKDDTFAGANGVCGGGGDFESTPPPALHTTLGRRAQPGESISTYGRPCKAQGEQPQPSLCYQSAHHAFYPSPEPHPSQYGKGYNLSNV